MSSDTSPIARVRRTNEKSMDPRVSRSRAKIFAAVETLVASHAETISVPEIVREAGISKTTFYSHFASFEELALQVVQNAYADVADLSRDLGEPSPDGSSDGIRASFGALVRHYVEHRTFYVAVLARHLPREVHTRAVRTMAAFIEPGIAANPRLPAGIKPHFAASLIASAVVGFLDEWLEDDFDATADELVDHLVALLPPWYTSG